MNKLASSALGTLIFLTLQGCAEISIAARLVDVAVINRANGERLTPYRHGGRLYIAGSPGEPYSIELKSRLGERVLTVVSVDGVNVLSGETAAALQSGYVLDAGQRYAISGWRKSLDDVARFVFTALPDSYAARTGRPVNVGVIGVAVYREKLVPPPINQATPYAHRPEADYGRLMSPGLPAVDKAESGRGNSIDESAAPGEPTRRAETGAAAPAAAAALEQRAKKIGTGHGEREYAPARYTEFARNSDAPDEVIAIYYDSRANLMARGIIPASAPRFAEPQPFPAGGRFVADPRG